MSQLPNPAHPTAKLECFQRTVFYACCRCDAMWTPGLKQRYVLLTHLPGPPYSTEVFSQQLLLIHTMSPAWSKRCCGCVDTVVTMQKSPRTPGRCRK
jgi:hypothetical protein